jgi:hypothetical protein
LRRWTTEVPGESNLMKLPEENECCSTELLRESNSGKLLGDSGLAEVPDSEESDSRSPKLLAESTSEKPLIAWLEYV